MKSQHFLIVLLLFCTTFAWSQDQRYIYHSFEFEPNSIEFLYGDEVVLRKKPNPKAKAFDTLAIGTRIKILEKTDESMLFRGRKSPWYKVQYGQHTGYILGGLIALDHKFNQGKRYMISLASDSANTYARCRVLKESGEYYGHEIKLTNEAFSFEVYGNRGVDGIESIVYVNYLAEACGVEGGGVYLFDDGMKLKKAWEVSQVSDAGAFWFSEELFFPEDDNGELGYIIYEREIGQYMDEEMHWIEIEKTIRYFRFEDGEITPNLNQNEFWQTE